MDKKPLFDNVPDDELGALLYHLFVIEGHDEIEIQHPTEGLQIVTKDNYKKTLASIMKVKKMSPAKRLLKAKQVKTAHQTKHRTQMLTANFHVVNMEDDENFGLDVSGQKIDMKGMTFVQSNQYLKGVRVEQNEIGAFVHPENKKAPLRIINLINKS